jgi:hypothetical protein
VIRRVISAAVMTASLAVAGLIGAGSAMAEPTVDGQHCLLSSGSLTCYATAADVRQVAPAAQNLVRVWANRSYSGAYTNIYGPTCSESTTDLDFDTDLGPLRGRGSSVTKYSGSNCNWQLQGPNGARSTWVEGSRANLAALGNGWEDRAVRIRIT